MEDLLFKDSSDSKKSYCSETFSIPKHLIGLAMGDKGSNIKKIRGLKCVNDVHFDKRNNTFVVKAYNEEIVKIVRGILEYDEWVKIVPRVLSELLQHDNGNLLQHIINQTGLVRAEILDDINTSPEKQSEYVTLKFIGAMSSIVEAKSRITTVMESNEYSELQAKKEAEKKPQYKCIEKFVIPCEFAGLALGKDGSNIQKARKILGVAKIDQRDLDELVEFTIYGDHYDGIKEARKILEITQGRVYIPQGKVGLVIGKKGSGINEIVRLTGVKRIDVDEKNPRMTDCYVPVKILGQPNQVGEAITLIENKVHLRT